MTGSSAVGVGSPFENGNTSFFVDVPTSNTFFRLLCLTERIFTAAPQLPVEGTRCFSSSNQLRTTWICGVVGPADWVCPRGQRPASGHPASRHSSSGRSAPTFAAPRGIGTGALNAKLGWVVMVWTAPWPPCGWDTSSRPFRDHDRTDRAAFETGYLAPVAGNGCTKIPCHCSFGDCVCDPSAVG